MTRVVILGAGGRDFHDFNVVFRDDPESTVVAFTAAQIPGIDDRTYPSSLAGPRYPDGIPIRPEHELAEIIRAERVGEVVLSYSDLSYSAVMHTASIALAAGAGFRLLSPRVTMLASTKPVVAVCATRTGCGKSQTSRRIGRILRDNGFRVVFVRHPMPYGDLEQMRVQRFETIADIDAANPTVEEREEYETPVREGMVVFAGVDYQAILDRAVAEADVIVWDGGNNDLPFFAPDLFIVVADPLRAGDELAYHPGEVNLRMADVVVVNKVDSARPTDVQELLANIAVANPSALVVRATSPVTLGPGPDLQGRRVLVVEDGPTITHGGMAYGAGTVAARQAGAGQLVDPRPWAVGALEATFARFPHIGAALPAMGYSPAQLDDLARTIRAVDCDVVVTGTPVDLAHLIDVRHPLRHATYELCEIGHPDLADALRTRIAGLEEGSSVPGERLRFRRR
ncbi:MAG: cyclic 2,3-diphosphoglycerate synthase [Acidimicrobiia bacterium]